MIVSSGTKKPKVHASAYVAPSAVVAGDVTIEEDCAILHGAVITAEGAPIEIGANSVIMENAVLKSSGGTAISFPLTIGESCIVGPGAYVVGATIEPGAFIASGARIFNGAVIEEGVSVAIGGIVHVNAHVKTGQHVPMAHTAHGENFFQDVFNLPMSPDVRAKAAQSYAKFLRKSHAQDTVLPDESKKPAAKAPIRKTREEPPPTQAAEVDKVVDVMFVELEEARMRREHAIQKDRAGKKPQ